MPKSARNESARYPTIKMKLKTTTLSILSLFALGTISSQAATVFLTNASGASGELGELLDGLDATDIGTPAATVTVPGFTSLDLTLLSIASDAASGDQLNATASSFGINDGVTGDETDAFDAGVNEIATFSFSQDVEITSLSFVIFTSGEVFNFGGVSIADSAAPSNTFTFVDPLAIAANTSFNMQATTGTVGLTSFEVTVVPEPSAALFGAIGALALLLRRR